MQATTTAEAVEVALRVFKVVADAIRELREVPSGHLYAMLMGKMTLQQYEGLIGCLKRSGLVKETGHLLVWLGTDPEAN